MLVDLNRMFEGQLLNVRMMLVFSGQVLLSYGWLGFRLFILEGLIRAYRESMLRGSLGGLMNSMFQLFMDIFE